MRAFNRSYLLLNGIVVLAGLGGISTANAFGKRTKGEVSENKSSSNSLHGKDGVYRGSSRTHHTGTTIPYKQNQGSGGGNFFSRLFGGGGGDSSGLVTPRKSSFSGNTNTIYFDVDANNHCKAGTVYWYDKSQGWMECRALNRTTGYSVTAGQLGTNASGTRSDGSTCNYRKGNGGGRGPGEVLPEGWSSGVYDTKKPKDNWGPQNAVVLDDLIRIHGRKGLGETPTLSQLELIGGAAGCVVTSDSCMRAIGNNIKGVSKFKVQ